MIRGMALQACAAWPVGDHPVARIGDDDALFEIAVAVRVDLARTSLPDGFYPPNFDPAPFFDAGQFVRSQSGLVAEEMGGGHFLRLWLDLARVAFPGVRWQVHSPPAYAPRCVAYGSVGGRVVAIVGDCLS